jgi:hypothetical protein
VDATGPALPGDHQQHLQQVGGWVVPRRLSQTYMFSSLCACSYKDSSWVSDRCAAPCVAHGLLRSWDATICQLHRGLGFRGC